VLVGRSAPGAEAEESISALRSGGVRVTVASLDVAEREPLSKLLDVIRKEGPPLRGVVHAAGVIDDGMLAQMTVERFAAVWRPKVLGASHLDALTSTDPLDFFVLYSSGASLLGSPGQCNYAAANAYLDALAHRRRAEGRPALAINWGPWADVGLAAREGRRGARLSTRGLLSLTPEEGMEALDRLLEAEATHVAIMPFDLRQWRQFYPRAAESPVVSGLLAAEGAADRKAPMRVALVVAEPSQRLTILEAHLVEQIAEVLGMSKAQIDAATPLKTLGLDSLMALELRNRLEASLGVTLSATLVWGHPTAAALGKFLADKMELSTDAALVNMGDPHTVNMGDPHTVNAPSAAANLGRLHDHVRQMSDEEAEAALAAELSSLGGIAGA
jgi:epothilone polyketide synthase D